MCDMIKSLQKPQLRKQGSSSHAIDESSMTNCKEIDQTGKDNKKQNLRQRLRSMRENWSDGPLLASFEDINDIEDNDNTFVVASKSRKGKKVKSPKLENKLHNENDTTAPSMFVPFRALYSLFVTMKSFSSLNV